MPELPVDHGWAWIVAVGVFINFFWTLTNPRVMGIFFIQMSEFFDASSASTSLMFIFFTAAFTIAGALYGLLADRFSDRQLCIAGCLLHTLGTVIQVFSPNIYVFTASYGILTGTGNGLCLMSVSIIMGRYFKDQIGLVSGLTFMGSSVGQLIMPQLINYLLQVYGIRGVFLIYGACFLNSLPGAMLFRPPSFYNRVITVKGNTSAKTEIEPKGSTRQQSRDEDNISQEKCKTVDNQSKDLVNIETTKLSDSITMVTSRRLSNVRVELVIQPDDHDVTFSKLHYFTDASPFVFSQVSSFWAKQNESEQYQPTMTSHITFVKACIVLCHSFHFNVLLICRMVMLGTFFNFIMFAAPFTYSRGFSMSQTSLMITIIGALDLCSKPLHGWIASMKNVDVTLYSSMMTLIGCLMCTICSLVPGSISTYMFNISGAVFFNQGLTLGVPVWKKYVGSKLFPVAFNIGTAISGIYVIAIGLFVGWLSDVLHSFDLALVSVYSTGGLVSLISIAQWLYLRWNKTSIADQLEEKMARVN